MAYYLPLNQLDTKVVSPAQDDSKSVPEMTATAWQDDSNGMPDDSNGTQRLGAVRSMGQLPPILIFMPARMVNGRPG
jgi:hypothetical protein